MDAIVMGPTSITIVDFKDYDGSVRISEEGEWRTDAGIRILGGARDANPFKQVFRYKLDLARWLKQPGLLRHPNDLGHISGLVMFTRPMVVDDTDMGPKPRKWFQAASQEGAMEFLRNRASPSLALSRDLMDAIVERMGASPFELRPVEAWVPASSVRAARQDGYLEAVEDMDFESQREWWAQHGEAQNEAAKRDFAIEDAIRWLQEELEARHPRSAFPAEVANALHRAVHAGRPSAAVVLAGYQSRTDVDLVRLLRSYGLPEGWIP